MWKFIKNWTLPIAMIIGALGYPIIIHLHFLMPYLIFFILLFAYTKVSFKELRIERLHIWLLVIQVIGSAMSFILLLPINKYVAESAMLCFIAPTAAAAAVVTGKLGGNVSSLTSYTISSSLLTAIAVPLFFPIVTEISPFIDIRTTHNFILSVIVILSRIFPILVGPLFLSWVIRRFIPKLHQQMLQYQNTGFYLWGCSLTIVTAVTMESLINSNVSILTKALIATSGLVVCCLQFYIGKNIGAKYNQRISGGQALGQKNTVLTIWISQAYLNPISSIGPCSYVIWQNIINSWQLWKKRKSQKN